MEDLLERDWQACVVRWATDLGWTHFHDLDARGSDPGWPDLVLCRPPELLFAELKTDRPGSRLRDAQADWIDRLIACGQEVYVWRPSDEAAVLARLSRPRRPALAAA